MGPLFDDGRPIFRQIADRLEDDIINGRLPEGSQVPSTNEFAAFYRINPATAAKGVNVLVDAGLLYKQRGIGMFVKEGAREQLLARRRERFLEQFVLPMLKEADKLGISRQHVIDMIENSVKGDVRK